MPTRLPFSITALQQQLDGTQQTCADQQAQLSTLESHLADANQTAFRATALAQQLAGAQQICADQAEQVQQLEIGLGASCANMVESIAALELQMAEVGQTAQTQQELLVKYQSQSKTLQQELHQSVVTSQAKQAKAESTTAALHQTVSGFKEASQQQISMLQTQTAKQPMYGRS